MHSNEMIDVDLPSLQSIKLGKFALYGQDEESSSLLMQSTNDMI